MRHAHVLAPIRFRGVELKNRVVRTAHGTTIGAQEPGCIGPNFIGYHLARAEGGVGLSILEICSVHPSCYAPIRLWEPGLTEGYKRLMDVIRPTGMRVMQQLWHAGHSARPIDGSPPWAPSDIPSPLIGIVPLPMTKTMIDEIVDCYASGARLARACDLDGIEIHAAHTYLIQQFLSPAFNRREDDYGGSLQNRMRFLMEVLRAVRSELGPDLALSMRLSDDGLADGATFEMNREILAAVEKEGLIDFANFSMGSYFSVPNMIAPMSSPTGYMLATDAIMSKGTKLPRLVAGRFRTLEEADQVIRLGQAEMVSMVRPTIADPHLVRKTIEGRPEDVRPCIACNQTCVGNINRGGLSGLVPMSCTVNPTTGKEATMRDDEVDSASAPRKLLIIGGGPAGMEAARIAVLRGHRVTLAEASNKLGGQINLAKRAPFRHTIGDITDWLERQLYRHGVDIRLNTFMDADDVRAEAADAVLVATGSHPRMDGVHLMDPSTPIAGIGQSHVMSSHDFMANPPERIAGAALIGDDVGHYEAVAVAETMLARGASEVIFVTRLHSLAPQMDAALTSEPAKRRLYASGRFRALPNSAIESIGSGSANLSIAYGTIKDVIKADLVVLVSFNRRNDAIYEALRDEYCDIRMIGDALAPRYLEAAIRDGNLAGRAV
jgi:2,4-dienoyl-CoA reductase-like NADH-dependent reductase (Old Yellow Enzyme family)/thioredoxin reductase